MKHPNKDEWVPYIFGEAPTDEAKRLRAHLENCANCEAEVTAWRQSLGMLDRWEVPGPVRNRAVITPVFRWAIAAALVLAAGIAIGRMSAPDVQTVRAQVEASVKTALAEQLQQSLGEAETRIALASDEQAAELWDALSRRMAGARNEDWQAIKAALEEQGRQHEARYVGLRRDLETLAVRADQEMRHANFRLTQLAGNAP